MMQPGAPSPGLAFVLGLIPGVGAIYNSQYVKGLVHVIVLGTLISLVDSNIIGNLEPLFGMLIGLWVFYMAFEAYHTANRRLHGLPVDEFSSLIPLRSPQAGSVAGPDCAHAARRTVPGDDDAAGVASGCVPLVAGGADRRREPTCWWRD